MKRLGFWNLYNSLSRNNFMFTSRDAPIGDDLLLPFNRLAAMARARGVECVTLDLVSDFSSLMGIVLIDFPNANDQIAAKALRSGIPLYLITFEPTVVRPENWLMKNLIQFRKIFTWHDGVIERSILHYVKINYAQRFGDVPEDGPTRSKVVCMFASNKSSGHPLELYSLRREAISWFEQNHQEDFALYGPGWDGHSTWRGTVPPGKKREVMSHYRFAICYENAILPGYITEKIFDCFSAGTIPIYFGAPNIDRYIPDDCYVDWGEFETYDDLYRYLVTMSPLEHRRRITAIRDFIGSPAIYQFTTECFAKTILDVVMEEEGPRG